MKQRPLTPTMSLLWLGLPLSFIFAIALLLSISPNDYWWYVRLGGDIARQGAIPTADAYTYTHAGEPMVYHSWLSAVLFWGLRQAGGNTLTSLARGVLLLAFYTLIWKTCRLAGAGPKLAALLTLLAAMAGSNNWAMRPQLFSYPLFGLTLLSLQQWRRGKDVWLWLLPPIVALWVNLHGAFALPFLLVGAAIVGGGGNRKALLLALGGMLLASLLNPRGAGAWGYVLKLLTDPSSQQLGAEWKSPTTDSWQGKLFFMWLLLFPALVAFSAFSRQSPALSLSNGSAVSGQRSAVSGQAQKTRDKGRLTFTEWLWFLGFGWMAVSGLRYGIWFLAILAPLSASLLAKTAVGRFFDRRNSTGIPVMNAAIFALLLLMPLALLPGVRESWWDEAPPQLSENTPVAATDWLAQRPDLPGQLWADLAYSVYLIDALPERPVWIDTRFELFPPEQWEQYVEISEAAPGWDNALAQEGVNLLMLDTQREPRLVKAAEQSAGWDEVYRDERAVIFVYA
ncbi:MAG TPA: hypothetical protein ENK24_04825, partial [Anaerolineae bacterium]|nr:hypothetical protein [Anaerolineae bacterium]